MINSVLFRAAVIAISGTIAACALEPTERQSTEYYESNAVLVVIDDPRDERRKRSVAGPGYSITTQYDEDPALHRAAQSIATEYGVSILEEWPLASLDAHCLIMRRPARSVIDAIEQDERVRWVQPLNSFEAKFDSSDSVAVPPPVIEQFALRIPESGRNVKIAVVDTAIDRQHPGFRNSNISTQNFAGRRGDVDKEAHGTAVVGLIAAKPAAQGGMSGLANDSLVHLLRGCWQDPTGAGRCDTFTLSLALEAAIDLNVDVVNLSVSGPSDRLLDALVEKLLGKGTLIVAAYDENREATDRFPQAQDGVIYGYGVADGADAPRADNILYAQRHAISLTPMSGYGLVSGHSIATPQLAALAACLIERNPSADRAQIVREMRQFLAADFAGDAGSVSTSQR